MPVETQRRNGALARGDGPLRVFLDDDLEHRRPRGDDWIRVCTAPEAISIAANTRLRRVPSAKPRWEARD